MINKTTAIAFIAGALLVSGTACFAEDAQIAKAPSAPIAAQPEANANDQKVVPTPEQPKAADKQPGTIGGELQPKAPAK